MAHEVSDRFFKAPRYLFRKLNILRMIAHHADDIKTFVDVGCGAGELDVTLAELGFKGVGLDFSEAAVKLADSIRTERGVHAKQLTFAVGGLENVKKEKFDLVVCCEVLEHVEDDRKLLHDLVAHSNKYVLISVPAKQRLFDSSDEAVGHFRRYELPQLTALLDSAGLEVLELVNYGYPFTNTVRLLRKAAFVKKLKRGGKTASMENKSKESGINPVKPPSFLQKVDTEKAIKPLYHVSRAFNRTNLAEGYVALCRVR